MSKGGKKKKNFSIWSIEREKGPNAVRKKKKNLDSIPLKVLLINVDVRPKDFLATDFFNFPNHSVLLASFISPVWIDELLAGISVLNA